MTIQYTIGRFPYSYEGRYSMSLTIHVNKVWGSHSEGINNDSSNKSSKKSLFAGDLNLVKDPIAEKRKQAREQALKVVQNAWENQLDIDKTIQSKLDQYQKIQEEKNVARKELESINSKKTELQELYGADSAEYQSRVLELDEQGTKFKKDIETADKQTANINDDIRSINRELLKSSPMLDAQKNVEDIMEASTKEIIGMLVDESKEHTDEVLEEIEEKAEKSVEKAEEKEEKLEELREMKAIQEAIIAGTKEALDRAEARRRENNVADINLGNMMEITKSQSQMKDAQKSLQNIKNSMNLVEADLKGIEIDQEI